MVVRVRAAVVVAVVVVVRVPVVREVVVVACDGKYVGDCGCVYVPALSGTGTTSTSTACTRSFTTSS